MSQVLWNDSLSVSIPSIDTQHKALIAMINELDGAILRGQSMLVTGAIIEKLLMYAEHHFAYEEQCMKQCAFAQIETHRCQHDELREKVKEFSIAYANSVPGISEGLLEFLYQWLQGHILRSDKQYTSQFQSHNIT
ncbi:MAG: bacteriohemerythrin [Bacteroidota bacterium]